LQKGSHTVGVNQDNVRREASRTFRNKRREYLKEKLMTLKRAVRTKICETYIEAYMNLRMAANLEVT
jgi:hypothetical protein